MTKCKGGCQMKSGGKACSKCGCDMEDEEYEKGEKEEKEMRSGGSACMKCGGKMHKSGGTVSSCMKCGGGKYTFGGKVNWSKKKVTSNSSEKYASGGMIKRADGSYSQRGLWDNIRANAGSGKKPTKQMLEQEKKIKQKMAVGGAVDKDCPDGYMKMGNDCVPIPKATRDDSIFLLKNNQVIRDLEKQGFEIMKDGKTSNSDLLFNFNDYVEQVKNKVIKNDIEKGRKTGKYNDYVDEKGLFFGTQDYLSDGGEDKHFPKQYIHPSIKPQYSADYHNKNTGEYVYSHFYDDLAITPDDMLTPEQLEKKRNTYNPDGSYIAPEQLKEKEKQKNLEYEKELETLRQELIKTSELELANRPQEPDYYNMKTIGFSPEDAKIIYELQGLGPISSTRGDASYEKDLQAKLKAYKAGREFAPIMQQVGGYNNIPRHDFSPTLEDVKRFREEPGYRKQWDKEILMQYYGMKPIDFQATNKRKQYSFGGAVSSLKRYSLGGAVDHNCPPGMKWDESIQNCVSVWDSRSGYKKEDYRPYLLNQIPKNRKENPIKYYDEGDPEGIKAYQSYADSSALYNQSIKDIQNFNNNTLPSYKPNITGSRMGEAFDKIFYPSGITPVGQLKSSNSTQCSKDGVCIDVYSKPVQPIGFKKKMETQMDPKQTLGYKMSEITQTPNTYEDRKSLAREYGFEKLTGRPYTGTGKDNEDLYNEIVKVKEEKKNITNNPTTEQTPKVNNEPEIMLSPEIINMPMKKPGIIPTTNITSSMMNTNSQGISEQGAYGTYTPNSDEGAGKESNPSSPNKKYEFKGSSKFSPEDGKILYELQGMGPVTSGSSGTNYEDHLDVKLKMYKSGNYKFAPLVQKVGGYDGTAKHDFYPTEEDLRRFRDEPGYRAEWDKKILMEHFGYKPEMFHVKNKRKQYSFGGALYGMKKYQYGGEIDNTAMTTDAEMPLSKGAYNVPEPTYDASVVSNKSPMQVTDNVTQGTEQLGYKEIVKSFQKKNIDKSLPNWGYAKQEQIKLNELIRNDISAGNAKMDLLGEDDIIGDNTLKAMRVYEASGQYTRPEGFKDKWLAEYKKQWEESKKPKQETPKVKTPETKQPESKQNSFFIPSMSDIVTGVQSGFNYGSNAINNFIQGAGEFIQGAGELIDKYQNATPKKASDQPKVNENNNLDDLYSYFNNYKEKPKSMPAGWSVMRPEEPKGGWPKAALLQEGGIEISSSDLKRKDFDTYFKIPGVTTSEKGIRATGRDKNISFFDAVEKSQKKRKDGTSSNTSLQLIDKLLSSSNKAIIIPKGKEKYGRDLNDIYLQDPNYPDRFHALDSLGVLEGEAIFGTTLFPLPENLTPRQQKINKQAEEKGGYKYKQSPYDFRKFEKLGIKEDSSSSIFENTELESEILNRQKYDNQRYGKFMSKGKDIANRTDIKRNADSEAFFADYAEPNSVIIDIGSALGNPNPSLAGVSVSELAKNQSIKKKGIKVIGTDIPSEVETFRMHQRNKQALDIDYAEVPMSYNTPVTKILKDKNLSNRENVYLRSANSIDLLMTQEETKQHLEHIAKTLKDKNVTYVFNNIILTKPKGLTMFGKVGNINNAAFDHNTPSWKSNTNRKPYTLNS